MPIVEALQAYSGSYLACAVGVMFACVCSLPVTPSAAPVSKRIPKVFIFVKATDSAVYFVQTRLYVSWDGLGELSKPCHAFGQL